MAVLQFNHVPEFDMADQSAGLGIDMASRREVAMNSPHHTTSTASCERSLRQTEGPERGLHPSQESAIASSRQASTPQHNRSVNEYAGGLDRHGTLLSVGAPPGRNAAELNAILGSSNARLRSGATLLPPPGQRLLPKDRTTFEQARTRTRVEVDLVPYTNVCVQGGYLHGHIKVNIRTRRSHKEPPVMLGEGKVRLIGFECISNDKERYPFYQCSTKLSEAAPSFMDLYESPADSDGFSIAREGEFSLPFSMHIPISSEYGLPKGTLLAQAGVAIRYIAMISIKCKEFGCNKPSIAHFYRNCEVWPRLNPAAILAPDKESVSASSIDGSSMGCGGKVGLKAILHRSCWIAGQTCTVKICVNNDTKKTVKGVTLALIRSVIVFKPHRRLDTLIDGEYIADPDACQTFTSHKQVAESVLEMGQRSSSTRQQASAKGWWTGVLPGERRDFSHSIHLPQGVLTVCRSQLLEVNYSLQVTLHAGPLQTLDAQVVLPIRIVNFLSIDPPPSSPLPALPSRYFNKTIESARSSSETIENHLEIDPVLAHQAPICSLESVQEYMQHAGSDDDQDEETYMGPRDVSQTEGQVQAYEESTDDEEDLDASAHPYDAVQLFVDPDYVTPPTFSDLYHQSIQNIDVEQNVQHNISASVAANDSDLRTLDDTRSKLDSELPWPPVEPSTLRRQPEILRSGPSLPSALCQGVEESPKTCTNSSGDTNTAITSVSNGPEQGDSVDAQHDLQCVNANENQVVEPGMRNLNDENLSMNDSLSEDVGTLENPALDALPSKNSSEEPARQLNSSVSKGNEELHSRSLPKPPPLLPPSSSAAGSLDKERDSMTSMASTGSSYSRASLEAGHANSDSTSTQGDEDHITGAIIHHPDDKHSLSPRNPVRPPVSPLGRTASGPSRATGSSHSVKERIRELEERRKILESKLIHEGN